MFCNQCGMPRFYGGIGVIRGRGGFVRFPDFNGSGCGCTGSDGDSRSCC